MLDVAIIGAGLCGLSLAHTLAARGQRVAVFEARDRVGGRVLTHICPHTGAALDLGPTWYWPQTEPRMAALLDHLGLGHHAQHDEGISLLLDDPNREPQALARSSVHGGAHRIEGGAARLIDALAAVLPEEALRTGLALQAVQDRGDHVDLEFVTQGGPPVFTHRVQARHVVLALPARMALERVRYTPSLPAAVSDALRDTPTWMATQAKSLSSHARPFWREAGQSGNAFVQHPQAVLGEVFDASPADPQGPGVLGGFSALSPSYRAAVSPISLALLVDSQWQQLFGPLAAQGHTVHHDWAREPWTCSELDRQDAQAASMAQPAYGDPLLRRPVWAGRLHFAGTETATYGAGHLEGALDAAARVARSLNAMGAQDAAVPVAPAPSEADLTAMAHFRSWVHLARQQALERYRGQVHQRLSTQRDDQLTQQALLACVEQVYSAALTALEALPAHTPSVSDVPGRSPLTPAVLAAFSGWNKDLLDQALQFNRSSCALSNFPDEAQPSDDYLKVITRDLVAAWREFALSANDVLLARACALA